MKEKLKSMYQKQIIDTTGILNAVGRGWITTEDIADIVGEENALDVIRLAKISEISKMCNSVIVSGVDITLGDESVHFNLSNEDQSNINNLFRVVEHGGTAFPYQADGGNCRIYSAEEIVQIYIAAQTLITAQTTYHNSLKQYVQSLNTIEDIAKVAYGMTLPEPYLSDMNDKLAVAQTQIDTIVSGISASMSQRK